MRFLLLIVFAHCIFAVDIQAHPPQREGNHPERHAHDLFRRIDQNRDQLITPDESPKWLMRRFARVDLDKDRAIDFPEFFYMFQRQQEEEQGSGSRNEIEPPVSENPERPTGTQPVTEESEHECEQNPRTPVPVI
ncbi:EF-hand domain-containing protein [Rubinisphaera sp.]|uniref:EF-hand domain-containing protein n=1 Tax=Rubinisphaera sp. TaxID=2024857 RepID=UPI000C0EC7BB|nr:EF-hand domain-containing protein [Rubinisphaera sp.]MBV08062.1 hypothetical protein [Rubinisphaera sp.]HCS51865.1 hypothetical protein [Planctomycetaceae bacterium]